MILKATVANWREIQEQLDMEAPEDVETHSLINATVAGRDDSSEIEIEINETQGVYLQCIADDFEIELSEIS